MSKNLTLSQPVVSMKIPLPFTFLCPLRPLQRSTGLHQGLLQETYSVLYLLFSLFLRCTCSRSSAFALHSPPLVHPLPGYLFHHTDLVLESSVGGTVMPLESYAGLFELTSDRSPYPTLYHRSNSLKYPLSMFLCLISSICVHLSPLSLRPPPLSIIPPTDLFCLRTPLFCRVAQPVISYDSAVG